MHSHDGTISLCVVHQHLHKVEKSPLAVHKEIFWHLFVQTIACNAWDFEQGQNQTIKELQPILGRPRALFPNRGLPCCRESKCGVAVGDSCKLITGIPMS